jgi:uncharacterized MnhB-related membrane protein
MRHRSLIVWTAAVLMAPFGCSVAASFSGLVGPGVEDAGDATSHTDASGGSDAQGGGGDAMNGGGDATTGPTYASVVLADGPIAYFHLDETSGSTARDASGGGHDGTILKGVTLGGSGAFAGSGTSAHFDGKSYITIPDSVSGTGTVFDFTQATPFTLEAWVKIDEQPVKNMTAFTFFSKELRLPDGGYDGIDFFTEPNFKLQRENDPTDTSEVVVPHGLAAIATWYYLVGTFDGKSLTIYVDLVSQGTAQSSTSLPVVNVPFLLGAEDTSMTESLLGSMDEVAIYRKALSASQMAAHFHAAGR